MSSQLSEPLYHIRQSRLMAIMQDSNLDALALNPGPSLFYLTGLKFHLMERPVIAIFTPHSPPVIVLPELEIAKIQSLPYPIKVFPYSEDPKTWIKTFNQAARTIEIDGGQVGVEPRRLRVLELRLLENAAPRSQFPSTEEILASLRMYKDEAEISSMRMAVDVAQRALQATLPFIKPGVTERQLAAELTLQLLRHGSEPEIPFPPIVASGPNSANPHAVPTERALAPGDLLILDWGATVNSYMSDLTRTFAIGQPDPEVAHLAHVVREANAAARAKAAPGVTASQVDQATRSVIDQAGYGRYFIHRTGHGLGLEGHEEPYIHADSDLLLASGMTFTIEPGIYIPGRCGVRVEDDYLVTEAGGESLSNLPRELEIIE